MLRVPVRHPKRGPRGVKSKGKGITGDNKGMSFLLVMYPLLSCAK